MKKFTRAWAKGKEIFPSVFGVKDQFAFELLLMKDIKLTKNDLKYLDIKNSSIREISRIQYYEASELLEKNGWKWIKK